MSDNDLIRRGDAIAAIQKSWTDDELILSISALPAAEIAVKPLEWIKHPSKDIWRATVGLGVYKVFGITSPSWDFDSWSDAKDKVSQSASTIEAAKAAAQSDYDARIRSALTVKTHDPAKVQALVEAADAMLDAFCIHDDSEQIAAHAAMCAALAAWKEK